MCILSYLSRGGRMGVILLFYKYVPIKYPKQIQKWQLRLCTSLGMTGRIIIAHEGINGTLGCSEEAADQYCAALRSHELFADIDTKTSEGSAEDFPRLSVVVRSEIATLGVDPERLVATQGGRHVTPAQAHLLMERPPDNLLIFDARNSYESAIGAFCNAVTPSIERFKELPAYIDAHIDMFRNKTVLMYCTGGVRCERASAYLKEKGVAADVLQIEGGIHRYAEQYPDGYFKGKNYVFDKRIALSVTDDVLGACMLCAQPADSYRGCSIPSCRQQCLLCPHCISAAPRCSMHRAIHHAEHGTVCSEQL